MVDRRAQSCKQLRSGAWTGAHGSGQLRRWWPPPPWPGSARA